MERNIATNKLERTEFFWQHLSLSSRLLIVKSLKLLQIYEKILYTLLILLMLYLQRIQIVCHDCKTFLRHFALIEPKRKKRKKKKKWIRNSFWSNFKKSNRIRFSILSKRAFKLFPVVLTSMKEQSTIPKIILPLVHTIPFYECLQVSWKFETSL